MIKFQEYFSLRAKMILSVCLIVTVVLAVNALLHIRSFRNEFIDAQRLRSTALVQAIVEDISRLNPTMTVDDMAGLLSRHCYQLYELSQKDGVDYIAVLQRDGRIIAHSSPDVAFGQLIESSLVRKFLKTSISKTVEDEKILHSLIPAGMREDVIISVGWKREGFDKEVASIVTYSFFLFVISVFVSSLLSYYLLNSIFNQLDLARRKAEAAARAKSDFLSNMSHEIRTPMNSVIGLADLLLNTPLNETQIRYVKSINTAGEALVDLINMILEITRFESSGIHLKNEAFEFSTLIHQVTSILEPKALAKNLDFNIEISPEVPVVVLGDLPRVRQVLVNFFGNAIKFTKQGEVRLQIRPDFSHLHWVEFVITDTGIGIPEEKLSLLFKRFSQIDGSITREFGGSGLGLVISQEIINAMGGEITVKSEVGKGSIFTFKIPLPPSLKSSGGRENEIVPDSHAEIYPLNILVADDTEESCELIKLFLKSLPYQLDFASNGLEAFELFKNKKYDLVLMDIQMPVLDGISATKMIRDWEKSQKHTLTPVIALTANALLEEAELIMSSGFNLHVTKPIKKSKLIEVIVNQTNKKEKI